MCTAKEVADKKEGSINLSCPSMDLLKRLGPVDWT